VCDCYEALCEHEGCKKRIPIHIADFCTDRKNVKAWCTKHIKEASIKATVYDLIDEEYDLEKVAILILDKDAYGTHPNCSYREFTVI